MAKRKFTKTGETPNNYQCTNKACKWEGIEGEKDIKKEDDWKVYCCPKCGNEEFYGLL